MARTKNGGNGRVDRLEEAMNALTLAQANLVQAQATLVQQQTLFLARIAEIDAQIAETNRINSERFARIIAILNEHTRILLGLPDVICDMLGFKNLLPQTPE
jgi:hypothetical protein